MKATAKKSTSKVTVTTTTIAKSAAKAVAKKSAGVPRKVVTVAGPDASVKQVKKLVTKAIAKTAAAKTGKKIATKQPVAASEIIQKRVNERMGAAAPQLTSAASVGKTATKKAAVKKTAKVKKVDVLAQQIVAFEADVLAAEGVTVKIYPIAGVDAKGAIKNTYSHAFAEKLTGKRSAVKQLLARLATIVDPAKAEVRVLDKTGAVVSPGKHLASIRA